MSFRGAHMKHYRLYKLDEAKKHIVKGKDIAAANDAKAVEIAHEDDDCPICELWQERRKVGLVE